MTSNIRKKSLLVPEIIFFGLAWVTCQFPEPATSTMEEDFVQTSIMSFPLHLRCRLGGCSPLEPHEMVSQSDCFCCQKDDVGEWEGKGIGHETSKLY